MTKSAVRYQLKIILNAIKPQIWRRIVAPGSLTLWQLHTVLQVVMGWEESHLHSFQIDTREYGDPSNYDSPTRQVFDENYHRLHQVIPKQVGFRFTYTYDFGDSWQHVLLVEKILPAEEGADQPICLDGRRACPPEDSGGPFVYMDLLEALKDPSQPENAERVGWLGEDFDPERFDLEEINRQLAVLLQSNFQLETLFFETHPEAEQDFAMPEGALTMPISYEVFRQVFKSWPESLPDDLKQMCENLAIRNDYLTLLNYLGEHKVKGTRATGNFPLKVAGEINERFVSPQPMEFYGMKVRGEGEMMYLSFLHILAFSRELIDGGPNANWVLTEEGRLFIEQSPAYQVLDMFMAWMLEMPWNLFESLDEDRRQQLIMRAAVVGLLGHLPAGEWIQIQTLMEKLAGALGRNPDDPVGFTPGKSFWLNTVYFDIATELEWFEVVEGKKEDLIETYAMRITPLGSNLLAACREILRA